MGGHRVATVLMYLSNVEKGGETIFPNSEAKSSVPKDENWSECAHRGYAVLPNGSRVVAIPLDAMLRMIPPFALTELSMHSI
ncbi:hypothetical protein K1719_041930 [Acacia pycnantha]|nr:hypothetical protein K1719_041930 [Acacia pycnantha]